MRKLVILFLACMPFIAKAQDRVMVIADPHVLPLSVIAQEADFDTYMAKQRKMVDLSEPIWNALIDTALAYRPSLVLIPGDLTRDGEPEAHELVSSSLVRLQEAGIRTLVIPGNHDLPGSTWESLYSGTYENAVKDPDSHSFAVSPRTGLTVIGIDGSDGNAGTGKLSSSTLSWILAQADEAVAKGHMIIAMSHWQILEHFDQKSTLESSCRFKNADALRDSLMHHGVHLVLTGHFHVNSITTYRDTTGLTTDSLVEISTGSSITYPCPYRWLSIPYDRSEIRVQTDYIRSVDTISDLLTYSREWMRVHTANMLPAMALRAWGKVDSNWSKVEAKLASINMSYMASILYSFIPQTDEAKIDLVQRHLGPQAIELYLFHSEANENEHPEYGQLLADSVYAGMDNMMDEVFGLVVEMVPTLKILAKNMAQEPVQSIVEDITLRSSSYSDQTDDLHPVLRINAPWHEAIEHVGTTEKAMKMIHDGQLILRVGDRWYQANGQQIAQ